MTTEFKMKSLNKQKHEEEANLLATLLHHSDWSSNNDPLTTAPTTTSTPSSFSQDANGSDKVLPSLTPSLLLSPSSSAHHGHIIRSPLSHKATLTTPASEKRREYYLERQQLKRRDIVSQIRCLLKASSTTTTTTSSTPTTSAFNTPTKEPSKDDSDMSIDHEQQQQQQQHSIVVDEEERKKKQREKRQKKKKQDEERRKQEEIIYYSNNLMLAESMNDIPSSFESDWYAVPVPNGSRCLVITQKGVTVARDVNGQLISTFSSALPYGSPATNKSDQGVAGGGGNNSRYCILDCLFYPIEMVYHVLDVLCWKGYMYYDAETEFRFFWKGDKLSETTASTRSNNGDNPYPFISTPYYNTDMESLLKIPSTYNYNAASKQHNGTSNGSNSNNNMTIDDQSMVGQQQPQPYKYVLFYHRQTHYDFGSTPLLLVLAFEFLPSLISKLQQQQHGDTDQDDEDQD